MKRTSLISVVAFLLYAATFLSASNHNSTDEYDEDTYGPEDPIIWEKPVRGVLFYHKTHTMGGGLDCEDCHDDPFEMEAGAAEESDTFTMVGFSEGEYCGNCHDGETAFASDSRCTLCHIGIRGINRLQEKK